MDLIKNCKPHLLKAKNCKNIKERRKLILKADNCLIDAISEICKNCIAGNLKLKDCQIKNLRKFRRTIEILGNQNPVEKRRKIIIQKGGFMNILIPASLFLLEKFMKNV